MAIHELRAALSSKLEEPSLDKGAKQEVQVVVKEAIVPFVDEDINDLDNATEAWWATGDHIIAAHLLNEVDKHVKDCNAFLLVLVSAAN